MAGSGLPKVPKPAPHSTARMADVRELIQCFIKCDGVSAVVSILISNQLTQPEREAATAILDDLIAETTKGSRPQSPTPTGSTPVESTMGSGHSSRVYVEVPPRSAVTHSVIYARPHSHFNIDPILLPPLSKRTARRRIRRKQHGNVVNHGMHPLNSELVKTMTVSVPVGLAGSVLNAAEFHPIPRRYTRGSKPSAGASGHEWVRAEILQRVALSRARINFQIDILEALVISAA
ncbi:hypothetical protein BS47DRAFT_1390359 [Hydnum rufescens UP504]|uniref:Uncharacterized protein n=1 Tax=Hydnum rufescens UP504 TaxID=1448309 RepID=A0A9P6B3F8_9AGAM|nr:hypothetical protein BS47DRAFT_1390359 [Hydnum rufescens UP504]